MLPMKTLDKSQRKVSGVLLVLVVVCSLVASVATRYSSPDCHSPSKTTVVQKDGSNEPGRQRLTMSTANWLPAVVLFAFLQRPIAYRGMSSSEPVLRCSFVGQ